MRIIKYNKMKIKLFIIAFIASTALAFADETNFVLEFKDATKVTFALSEKPVLTFGTGMLHIASENTSVEYPLNDILEFSFKSLPTNIENVNSDNLIFIITDVNNIIIQGASGNENVSVCDITGKSMPVEINRKSQFIEIDTTMLSDGIYIINVNNRHSIKIIK